MTNRLYFINFLILLAIVPLSFTATKRGFVGNGGTDKTCDDPLTLNNPSWYYSYSTVDKYRDITLKGNCGQVTSERFVPMIYCTDNVDYIIPSYVNT